MLGVRLPLADRLEVPCERERPDRHSSNAAPRKRFGARSQ
jgi:hypothetical protein